MAPVIALIHVKKRQFTRNTASRFLVCALHGKRCRTFSLQGVDTGDTFAQRPLHGVRGNDRAIVAAGDRDGDAGGICCTCAIGDSGDKVLDDVLVLCQSIGCNLIKIIGPFARQRIDRDCAQRGGVLRRRCNGPSAGGIGLIHILVGDPTGCTPANIGACVQAYLKRARRSAREIDNRTVVDRIYDNSDLALGNATFGILCRDDKAVGAFKVRVRRVGVNPICA